MSQSADSGCYLHLSGTSQPVQSEHMQRTGAVRLPSFLELLPQQPETFPFRLAMSEEQRLLAFSFHPHIRSVIFTMCTHQQRREQDSDLSAAHSTRPQPAPAFQEWHRIGDATVCSIGKSVLGTGRGIGKEM